MAVTINASTSAGLIQTADTSGVLALQTAGTTAVTVDASQNVGIGTASPSSKLEVAGALTLTSVALPSAGTARLYSRNTDNCLYIQTGSGNTLYLLEGSQNTMYAASPTLHSWAINNSEKMRLNSSGNLGIGTTSPAYKLEVVNAATTPAAAVFRTSGFADDNVSTVYLQDDTANAIGVGGRIAFRGLNDVGSYTSFATIQGAKENATTGNNAGAMIFKTQPNGGALTERMRLNSSGSLQLKKASNETEATAQFYISGSGYEAYHWLDSTAYYIGQNSSIRSLRIYSNSYTAGVNLASGGTSWGTFSDERLKYDIEPITNGLDKLNSIRCVSYRLKDVDASDSQKKLGVIAQDLVGVVDEVIDITKRHGDETDYMSVRYTELIPVLVKAIQEQQALITQLQADVAALKGA